MARLILSGARDAATNMAIDSALMEVCRRDGEPILRLYRWEPSAISIGYFQGLEEEVDVEACKRDGVSIVRRVTGGGAVFHQHELTYSLILPEKMVESSILSSYKQLCGAVANALSFLGLDARFAPINDILVGGRKISGNAQTRRKGIVLQHGTILEDVDVDKMFTYLKVPQEKLKGKLIAQIKERVTSFRHLGVKEMDLLPDALVHAFESCLSVQFTPSSLSAAEEEHARSLAMEQFSQMSWVGCR